jgi:glycosyltransferase involved in cell wall biosynthesis
MKIGCLTLAFNQGTYLQSAISSVTSQEQLGEYYVYNPGSTDSTSEILESNSSLVTEIFVESDLGPADGLNSGLSFIKSEIFYYLNADDVVLPGVFTYVTDYFEKHPEVDILHGAVEIINQDGRVVRTLPPIKFSLKGYALGYSVVYQQATFFRSRCFRDVQFNIENRTCWDGELVVDLVLAGYQIKETHTLLGQFRIYAESITGSGRLREQMRIDHARIACKILGRELRKSEILIGILIGKFKAIHRRFFSMIQLQELN